MTQADSDNAPVEFEPLEDTPGQARRLAPQADAAATSSAAAEALSTTAAAADNQAPPSAQGPRYFPCEQCGASLAFSPGQQALSCPYCGHVTPILLAADAVAEHDYLTFLRDIADEAPLTEKQLIRCNTCGAQTTQPPHIVASSCAFCGSPVVTQTITQRSIKPESLLPFVITRKQAQTSFDQWLASLWFAPSNLKQLAATDGRLTGMYVPYWTYDCRTVTHYTGQRGDDYWVTESYTVHINGKSQRRTRQVRKTRWRSASGTVRNSFDDLLVLASRSLPQKYIEALEPWDLDHLVAYNDDFLAGFSAESYQLSLDEGFTVACGLMEPAIHSTIRSDIGGDHQRISTTDIHHHDITFKHLLLPVWISAYRYHQKVFRFLVNARTGEVQGERPWSYWKITALVVTILIALGIVAMVFAVSRQ